MEWISVETRLPECKINIYYENSTAKRTKSENVLVIMESIENDDRIVNIARLYDDISWFHGCDTMETQMHGYKVTYWMPVPSFKDKYSDWDRIIRDFKEYRIVPDKRTWTFENVVHIQKTIEEQIDGMKWCEKNNVISRSYFMPHNKIIEDSDKNKYELIFCTDENGIEIPYYKKINEVKYEQ